ncbi:replication factor A protein 2 [Dissophora globulifera]|nr:replication factor A protein 2 [Dissophora globulifera]
MSNYNNRSSFGNASQGQGFVQDSFSSDAGAPKKITNHSLRPVTIKQLQNAVQTQADGDFRIDGQDLHQFTFIAAVRGVNRQSTHHTFSVEDGTGVIDARRYPSEEEDLSAIIEGSYVRVVGLLKNMNDRFMVAVHGIRPILDMNELTYHNLEVIYAHVSLTRSKHGGMGMDTGSTAHGAFGTSYGGSSSSGPGQMAERQEQIAEMIRNHPAKETGVHRQEIVARFQQSFGSANAVNSVISHMIEDGFVYPAEDEDHLMSAY